MYDLANYVHTKQPTLNPTRTEDVVWVNRLHWNKYGGRPGDVIAFISPSNSSHRMVKRIIGVEKNVLL